MSNEVRMPAGCMERSSDRKSSVELIWYWAGINGVMILFSCLAVS